MKKISIIILAFLLLYTSSFALDENLYRSEMPETNVTYYNGRYWNTLNETEKYHYLLGMAETINMCSTMKLTYDNIKISEEEVAKLLSCLLVYLPTSRMTYGEIILYLNNFYSEPLNVNIPIHFVYLLMSAEQHGLEPDKDIKEQRKLF